MQSRLSPNLLQAQRGSPPGADGAALDLYGDLARPARFVLAGGSRTISVTFDDGYRYAQIYAPADAPLICFEPMTAPTNALLSGDDLPLVAPGGAYRASFSIAVPTSS